MLIDTARVLLMGLMEAAAGELVSGAQEWQGRHPGHWRRRRRCCRRRRWNRLHDDGIGGVLMSTLCVRAVVMLSTLISRPQRDLWG